MKAVWEKNKEVRSKDNLELIGHWFKQGDSVYFVNLNN